MAEDFDLEALGKLETPRDILDAMVCLADPENGGGDVWVMLSSNSGREDGTDAIFAIDPWQSVLDRRDGSSYQISNIMQILLTDRTLRITGVHPVDVGNTDIARGGHFRSDAMKEALTGLGFDVSAVWQQGIYRKLV